MDEWLSVLDSYVKIYDSEIDFQEYYRRLFPNNENKWPCKCELHDEKNGESFSYSKKLNIWSCWGACHDSGGPVKFHRRYMQKMYPNFSLVDTLRSLRDLYPNLPEFEYSKSTGKTDLSNNDKKSLEELKNRIENYNKNKHSSKPVTISEFKNLSSFVFYCFSRGAVERMEREDELEGVNEIEIRSNEDDRL